MLVKTCFFLRKYFRLFDTASICLQTLLRDAFVCMGQAHTTDTEAWVSQAKTSLNTSVTTSSQIRPISALSGAYSMLPTSRCRPVSARSMPGSRVADSGIYSATTGSALYSDYQSILSSNMSHAAADAFDDIPLGGDLFDPGPQPPKTPRPSDEIVAIAHKRKSRKAYIDPPQKPAETESVDKADSFASDDLGIGSENAESDESSVESVRLDGKRMVVSTLDQFGDIIVATVLRSAVASVCGKKLVDLPFTPEIGKLLAGAEKVGKLSAKDLREMTIELKPPRTAPKIPLETIPPEDDVKSTILGDKSDDEDSVLNSDDDYEDERDDFFRRYKKVS